MTDRPIGYYVHHHGAGHRARARAIASCYPGRMTLLGTDMGEMGVDLPDDRPVSGAFDGQDGSHHRPEALHYAPLDHAGVRGRVATIARWIAAEKPALMIVDVSVEIAMLARLASVPVVYVRLNGNRNDMAHLDAFRGATALLAPFHQALEMRATPAWVRAKTRYLPGITTTTLMSSDPAARTIVIVVGRGGEAGDGEALAQAAQHCPQWNWRVIGPCSAPGHTPPNLAILGWVADPEREIMGAMLVVGAAGDGLVGSVLAADRPFICIPQDRPFDEQRATAHGLEKAGAAVVLSHWPAPDMWPGLIARAMAQNPDARRGLHDPDGARTAARWLASMTHPDADIQERAA